MRTPAILSRTLVGLGLCSLCFATPVLAQDTPATGKAKETDPQANMAAMMAAYEKASAPGPAHKQLQKMVGKWNLKIKMWAAPGAPPTEETGTAETKALFGDRYVQTNITSSMMGKPFTGMGINGYDNAKKKFVGTWVDSMSTGIMHSEGTSDSAGKVLKASSVNTDPVSGKENKMRTVQTWQNDDTFVEEFFEKRGGKEQKTMEITYTRAK
jgi:hypothetical protein